MTLGQGSAEREENDRERWTEGGIGEERRRF